MAAFCRACVVARSSVHQLHVPASSKRTVCGVPCPRAANVTAITTEAHIGALSLGRLVKGVSRERRQPGVRVSGSQQIVLLANAEVHTEQELWLGNERVDVDSEPLPQIVVPTLSDPQIVVPTLSDTDEQLAEEAFSEVLAADLNELDEVDDKPDLDETSPDFWLAEFQRHLPREVENPPEAWNGVSEYSGLPRHTSRRCVLGAPLVMSLLLAFGCSVPAKPAIALVPAQIDVTKVPKSDQFDATDLRLRDAVSTFRQALDASTVEDEEKLWTQVIDLYGNVDAKWVPDILARALGNRGNARSRQGQLELALGDYNRSIALAPYAVDPVLNRGVALEGLGRFDEASADYEAVLHAQPEDPAAWNNLGNVKAALSKWNEALVNYSRAVQLAPKFSFAAANYALALYQVGRDNEAMRQFRNLLRRYPEDQMCWLNSLRM